MMAASSSSSSVSLRYIRTLLWYHLTNQLRRIIATYVFPSALVLFSFLLLFIYFGDHESIQETFDRRLYRQDCFPRRYRESYAYSYSYARQNQFHPRVTVEQNYQTGELSYLSLCDRLDNSQILIEYPLNSDDITDSRYVFTCVNTFTCGVVLFYCVTLSELYQEKLRKTDQYLRSLGVSRLNNMISWYIAIFVQAMLWSFISCIHILPQMFSMATNIIFLWFSFSLIFMVTAMLAYLSAKLVRGTLTYLLCIISIFFVWAFAYWWTTYRVFNIFMESETIRLACLLHPVVQSINLFKLAQWAEFSKEGLSLASLNSTYPNRYQSFFGNLLQTFMAIFLSGVVSSVICWVHYKSVAKFLYKSFSKSTSTNSHNTSLCFEALNERINLQQSPILEVDNICKTYSNGFEALSNISFSLHPGEILALLGKNGAGKSTTMNIIAGFFKASSGTVKINNADLVVDRNKAISNLSFCPQDDWFFYRLTVIEHLKLICSLKGVPFDLGRANDLLLQLGLTNKGDVKPHTLSGGQKRRVCVAMAYIANSPLVILDEPTSAVDAATRKTLWSFFQQQQKANPHQAVILCTHFMEEADVLATRIAILSDGFLRAIGTSTYLKNIFGVGYTFTIDSKYVDIVKPIVEQRCPVAECHWSLDSDESSFQIPMDWWISLPSILEKLDERGIEYSFSAATLENVFVSLSSKLAPDNNSSSNIKQYRLSQTNNSNGSLELDSDCLVESDITKQPQKNTSLTWFSNQLHFSIFVDLLRVMYKNRLFLFAYTLLFFGLPQLLKMGCYRGGPTWSSSENTLEHGNGTVNAFTIGSDPTVAVFGNPPDEVFALIEAELSSNDIKVTRDVTFSMIKEQYLTSPAKVYKKYPFFLNYYPQTSNSRQIIPLQCWPNPHFEFSRNLCLILLTNIYGIDNQRLNMEVAYYDSPSSSSSSFDYLNDEMDSIDKDCEISMYFFTMLFLYLCLLFHILRIESNRNSVNLTSFFRANGAHTLFSLFVRILLLAALAFIYLASILIVVIIVSHFHNRDSLVGYLYYSLPHTALFGLAFACFAVLFSKLVSSVIIQLFVTVILGLFYLYGFLHRSLRMYFLEEERLGFIFLFGPGYVIPTGGLGLLFDSDEKSRNEAFVAWAVQFFVYFSILFLIDSLYVRKIIRMFCSSSKHESQPTSNLSLAVHADNIHHTYFNFQFQVGFGPKCFCCPESSCSFYKYTKALKGMSAKIPEKKCYAILGVNGAGKSTMLEVLTGANQFDKGTLSIFGKSFLSNAIQILKDFGYCSQVEKLPTYLRARSVVEEFGKMRGLSQMQIDTQIDYMVEVLDVESHMSKLLGSCSGGTKRKISTMVAFIGYPKLIILDECTTGVDPVTRRNFAKLIRDAKLRGSTVIISSHTMEECESVADTICIMKAGQSYCEDTPYNLKLHYGKFYSVAIKVYDRTIDAPIEIIPGENPAFLPIVDDETRPETSRPKTTNPFISFVPATSNSNPRQVLNDKTFTDIFPGAQLQYTFSAGLHRHMFYNIAKDSISLTALFARLELLKKDKLLEECVINTVSLEQIFMQISLEEEYTHPNTC